MVEHRTKKSHIVPQSYLKRFALDGEHLWVFDKASLKSYGANVRDVAQERAFYEIETDPNGTGASPQIIEQYLAQIEGETSQAVDNLLARCDPEGVPNELRDPLAKLVALQMARTKEVRMRLNNFFETGFAEVIEREVLDGYVGSIPSATMTEQLMQQTEANRHAFFLQPLAMQALTSRLLSFIWRIAIRRSNDYPLYTSDNPVVLNLIDAAFREQGGRGIDTYGVEIVFPLTPTVALWLFEPKCYAEFAPFDGTAVKLTDELVEMSNSLQVASAARQVICIQDLFDFARMYCHKVPGVRDPARFLEN